MVTKQKWLLKEVGNQLCSWGDDDNTSDSLELLKGDNVSNLVNGISKTIGLHISQKIELDESIKKILFLCHELK